MPRAELRRSRRGTTDESNDGLSVAESEARHRALLTALPEGVVLQDAAGDLLLSNPRARVLLGLQIEDDASSPPSAPGGTARRDVTPQPTPGDDASSPPGAPVGSGRRDPTPGPTADDGPRGARHDLTPGPTADDRARAAHRDSTRRPTPGDEAGPTPGSRPLFPRPDGWGWPGGRPDRTARGEAPRIIDTRGPADTTPGGTPVPAPRRASGPADDPDERRIGGAPGGPVAQLDVATQLALRTGTTQRDVAVSVTHGGRTRNLTVTSVPLLGADGAAQAVVSVLTDAPAAVPEPPRRGEDLFRQSMQHSPIGVAVTALNGRFLKVNRMLCRMLGYRADELQERTVYEILHAEDVEETSLQAGRLLRGDLDVVSLERRFIGHGEMTLWGRLSVTLVRDGQGRPLQFVVQIEDVSEVHRAQELLTHMTLHDPLTGLANRTLVLDRIQKALDRSRRHGRRVAVLQCDVDHFRVVNDSTGHERGDEVLVEVGRRVTRALRAGDTAGRPGGDEFVVVCEEVADEREAVAIAERLQRSVHAPLALGDRTLLPTVSVGIAISGHPDSDPLALLRDADIATHRAKARGRNRWDLVDSALRRSALDRLDLEHTLRAGIGAGELELHFQPIVDVGSREIVGREALVRWNHPERGLLGPINFLPVAEESGLIVEIGAWVLAEAARAAAASPKANGYVAINVSPNQVTRPGLAEAVEKSLAEAGLPPERLVVELTESVMLSEAPGARREIERLDDLGVRIVVDDFGTGFSALSYLRDLPVSGIKVDRSFTAGLGSDNHCERIVEALTGLGHGLGVDVIVEGVETEEQREMLASFGAEHAQGYLFGRPVPEFV